MELILDRKLPIAALSAIDIPKSGTAKRKSFSRNIKSKPSAKLRRTMVDLNPVEAMETSVAALKKHKTHEELLSKLPVDSTMSGSVLVSTVRLANCPRLCPMPIVGFPIRCWLSNPNRRLAEWRRWAALSQSSSALIPCSVVRCNRSSAQVADRAIRQTFHPLPLKRRSL